MAQIDIVKADTSHIAELAKLFNAYREFYKQSPDLAAAERFLQARIEHDESVVFLASLDGKPVGFTQLYPTFSSVSLQPAWILNDLYVESTARGHGVATALMNRAREHALATKAKGLSLETAADNTNAQRLYEHLGWVRNVEFYRYELRV